MGKGRRLEALGRVRMSVTLTQEMHKALQGQAKIRHRSVAGLVRLVLEDFLAQRGIEVRDKVKRGGYRVSPEGMQEYAMNTRLMVLDVKGAERKLGEDKFGALIPALGRGKYQVVHHPGHWHSHGELGLITTGAYTKITVHHPIGFLELGDVVGVRSVVWDRVVGRARVERIAAINPGSRWQMRDLELLGYEDGEAFLREHGQLAYWVIELAWVGKRERPWGVMMGV